MQSQINQATTRRDGLPACRLKTIIGWDVATLRLGWSESNLEGQGEWRRSLAGKTFRGVPGGVVSSCFPNGFVAAYAWPMGEAQKPKLLVIDDSEPLRMLLEAGIADLCDVYCAESGTAGINLAVTLQPQIILCDLLMPGINGHETIAQLRREPMLEDVPIVLMSGVADDVSGYPGFQEQLAGVLQKPFSILEIREVVTSVLANGSRQ